MRYNEPSGRGGGLSTGAVHGDLPCREREREGEKVMDGKRKELERREDTHGRRDRDGIMGGMVGEKNGKREIEGNRGRREWTEMDK